MTVLTRWEPFREFTTLQDRMNRLFRDSFSEGREEALTTSTFAPRVDVYEDEHNVTLKIEVPGIEEKDIDVRIENNTLDRAWRAQVREGRERRELPSRGAAVWQLHSFLHSAATRWITESVSANYDKGVLKIKLAKKAEAKPKQIKVNVGSEKTLEGKGASKAA